MLALRCLRISVASRIAGTDTNMMMKATVSPSVIGNPRASRLPNDSDLVPGGAFAPIASPSASGTINTSASQTTRIVQEGIQCGMGTKASSSAEIRGKATPTSRSGQATAAATRIERNVCCRAALSPNRARTAQPNMAFRIFPADLLIRARIAWRIAMIRLGSCEGLRVAPRPLRQAAVGDGSVEGQQNHGADHRRDDARTSITRAVDAQHPPQEAGQQRADDPDQHRDDDAARILARMNRLGEDAHDQTDNQRPKKMHGEFLSLRGDLKLQLRSEAPLGPSLQEWLCGAVPSPRSRSARFPCSVPALRALGRPGSF